MLIFIGASISLFGDTMADPQFESSGAVDLIATYTIDDQVPTPFKIVPNNSSALSNQMFFESGQLSPGQHKLVVTYLGNNSTQSLYFSYFIQQNAQLSTFSNTSTPSSSSVPSGSSSNPPDSSSDSSPGKPTVAIMGGVMGGLVVIFLLIALLFFQRRNNRRSNPVSEMSNTVPSPGVMNPFTLPPANPTSTFLVSQNYASNGQSLPSQSIPSKFLNRNQPASTSNSGGMPPLTPLRRQPDFSSPASSSEPPRLHLTWLQTDLDGALTLPWVPQATTERLIQRSPSPQRDNARFLWHEDSGVRMLPPSEDNVVEVPPIYTPG